MFTGIVAAVGRIESVEPHGQEGGVRLSLDAGELDVSDVTPGDSIAVQGACMTVTGLEGKRFTVDVSRESLSKTVGLDRPGEVNLEKALRSSDRLGGHLVAGHVDGVGQVVSFEPVGESWSLVIRAPASLARYLAYKGSVAADGVSLTVNRVADVPGGVEFEANLIPHTLRATTLNTLHAGGSVNLEVDMLARYVERMLTGSDRPART